MPTGKDDAQRFQVTETYLSLPARGHHRSLCLHAHQPFDEITQKVFVKQPKGRFLY